jgi:Tol biopolymer transport system component
MPKRRITSCAARAAFFLACILTGIACRGGGQAEEPTSMRRTSPAVLEAATEVRGRIVFQSDLDGDEDIYLLRGRQVTRLTDNAWSDRYPRWSPDGMKIAYLANPEGNFDLFVMDRQGEQITQVIRSPEDETDISWSPDGRGIAFSVETKKTLGKQRSVLLLELSSGKKSRLVSGFPGAHQLPDLSPGLPQVAFTGKKGRGWDVFLADLKEQTVRQMTQGGKSCRPRFSPDGGRIAYVSSAADGKGDIWIMQTDGSNPRRLTVRDESYDYFPSWSPDGSRVVFCSNLKDKYADKGEWGLYIIDLRDGRVTPLFDSPGRDVFPDWR